jgi:type IV pilus assembly protein PilX
MHASRTAPERQHGAVLIVALLFLVILTILGLTAMSGTTMEERMSGNTRDLNVAFQAAEAALRDARRDINGWPLFGPPRRNPHVSQYGDAGGAFGTCNTTETERGLCRPWDYKGDINAVMPASIVAPLDIANQYARYGEFTGAPEIRGTRNELLAQQPRYIVEQFCLQGGVSIGGEDYCKWYRITARGYGVNPNSQVTLQEVFLSL